MVRVESRSATSSTNIAQMTVAALEKIAGAVAVKAKRTAW
jgi:hypothetical protein